MIDRVHYDVQPPAGSESADELPDVWGILARRKWTVIPIVLVGVSLAIVRWWQAPPVYESTSTILVRNLQVEARMQADVGDDVQAADMQTQIVLLRSPRIVERAVRKHDLSALESLSSVPSAVAEVIDGLTAVHEPNTQGVLRLSYAGLNPPDCRTILAAVLESYGKFLRETHQNVNEETLQLVRKAKDDLLEQLNRAESNYREFKKNAPSVLLDDAQGGNIHRNRLASIEQQRSALLLDRSRLRGQIEAIERARQTGGNQEALAFVVGNMQATSAAGQPKTVAEQVFPLMLEEQMELQRLGPDHPTVRNLRKRVELTRRFLDGLVINDSDSPEGNGSDFLSIYVASLKQRIRINEDQVADLDRQFEGERKSARKYLDVEARHALYRNDIARKKALFEVTVHRLGEFNVLKDLGGYTMEPVTPPTAALRIGPSLARHLGVGALLGLLVGLAGAYWQQRSDTRFRAPEDIHDQIGTSVVAHIPSLDMSQLKTVNATKIDPTLCTFHQPQSQCAEAFRAVRVALYFNTRGTSNKVIQITSPSPGDGKSTLAANLAVSIANSGKRTLLVEADFRKPRVHELLGIDAELGLPALLRGDAQPADVVTGTEIENLWCIPCGRVPADPAELLASAEFGRFLEAIREQYDFVVLDTPPVLAVTDPCAVAARVDGIYMTMRLHKHARATASRAAEMLQSVGGRLLGVVVNGAGTGKQMSYGYTEYRSEGVEAYASNRGGYYGSDPDESERDIRGAGHPSNRLDGSRTSPFDQQD